LAEGGRYLALANVPVALDAHAQPLLTMDDQMDLKKRHLEGTAEDQTAAARAAP